VLAPPFEIVSDLAQPGGKTDRVSDLFLPFYLKEKENAASKKTVILLKYRRWTKPNKLLPQTNRPSADQQTVSRLQSSKVNHSCHNFQSLARILSHMNPIRTFIITLNINFNVVSSTRRALKQYIPFIFSYQTI
jgi:hypothetical protein